MCFWCDPGDRLQFYLDYAFAYLLCQIAWNYSFFGCGSLLFLFLHVLYQLVDKIFAWHPEKHCAVFRFSAGEPYLLAQMAPEMQKLQSLQFLTIVSDIDSETKFCDEPCTHVTRIGKTHSVFIAEKESNSSVVWKMCKKLCRGTLSEGVANAFVLEATGSLIARIWKFLSPDRKRAPQGSSHTIGTIRWIKWNQSNSYLTEWIILIFRCSRAVRQTLLRHESMFSLISCRLE